MSDIYNADDLKLYEDKLPGATKKNNALEAIKCSFNEPSGRFLQLISMFEKENLDMKLKFLSQKRLTAATKTTTKKTSSSAGGRDADDRKNAAVPVVTASGVAVTTTDCAVSVRPKRSLLVVVHPWCAFRKSAAAEDRQSEFPPPGFLERLRAKFLALHRETATAAERRRVPQQHYNKNNKNNKHRGPNADTCWIRYAAAGFGAAARPYGFGGNRMIVAPSAVAKATAADDNKWNFKNAGRRGNDGRTE